MVAMSSLFAAIFFLYAAFMIYFFIGLFRLKNNSFIKNTDKPTVSIVIASRNEEGNIRDLLEDLSQQTYPKEKLQIIIADDRSTDKTWSIIQEYCDKYTNISSVKISDPSKTMSPKKYALTRAIEKSSGEIIISTDAFSFWSSMASALIV